MELKLTQKREKPTKPGQDEQISKSWGLFSVWVDIIAGSSKVFPKLWGHWMNWLLDIPHQERKKAKYCPAQYHNPKERWTESCKQAFDLIIEKLKTAPVLGFANPKLPYLLHTDASTTGLDQQQDGDLRVVAFASRGLSKNEAKYAAFKLEFLALKWAVTKKILWLPLCS